MSHDMVKDWVSNARSAEYTFFNTVLYALEQFAKKNNKPMYALIAFTNGKKFGTYKIEEGYSLTQFKTPLKKILDKALSNVKFVFKDGKAKVVVGENGGANGDIIRAMQELSKLHNGRIGLKSETFKSFVASDETPEEKAAKAEKAKADWDVEAWAARAVKAHPSKLDAMIAALQAQRS